MAVCKSCRKTLGIFTISKTCCKCGAKVCGECAKKIDGYKYEDELLYLSKLSELDSSKLSFWSKSAYFCKSCSNSILPSVYKIAACKGGGVRTYSVNYQGDVPSSQNARCYQTEYYKDRDNAFLELKVVAEYLGATSVVDVELLRDVAEDGNYKFSVWAAKGSIILK